MSDERQLYVSLILQYSVGLIARFTGSVSQSGCTADGVIALRSFDRVGRLAEGHADDRDEIDIKRLETAAMVLGE